MPTIAADPTLRMSLLPKVREYCLRQEGDGKGPPKRHASAARALAAWIVTGIKGGDPSLPIAFVCTGNSRRSSLAAVTGNIAAQYHGLPQVRCLSAGTTPSALHANTIDALTAIGVLIEATSGEAVRGQSDTPNRIYRVRWAEPPAGARRPIGEMLEFSKRYDDPTMPKEPFAAVMVCDDADENCPVVPGADLRVSAPFADPKQFDGIAGVALRYAERRDEIARFVLDVMRQAADSLK